MCAHRRAIGPITRSAGAAEDDGICQRFAQTCENHLDCAERVPGSFVETFLYTANLGGTASDSATVFVTVPCQCGNPGDGCSPTCTFRVR